MYYCLLERLQMLCIILGKTTISVMYILLSPYVFKQLPTSARFKPYYSFSNLKGLATVASNQEEIDGRRETQSKQLFQIDSWK